MNETPNTLQPPVNETLTPNVSHEIVPGKETLTKKLSPTALSLLRKFAEDAYYLHSYSVTSGKKIPEEISQAILECKHQCDQEDGGALDLNMEVRFSSAYRQLAALMYPVTVESLRDTEEIRFDPTQPTYKRLHVSKARQVSILLPTIAILLILTILLCEIVQAIFIPGLRDITAKEAQIETLMTNIGNNPTVLDQIDKGNNEIKAMLKNLKAAWDNLMILPSLPGMAPEGDDWLDNPESIRFVKTRFAIIVEALNRLLPVLYGALGATAYLLRVLIPHITQRTFNKKHAGSISVRICLGMLSGIAIQWFFTGQQTAQIFERSLSTSALAFLAGYSVDLLFNMMDRFVQGFKPSKPAEKSGEEPQLTP